MCVACRIERRRTKPLEAVVDRGVDNRSARIAARTVTHADGRTRYHGRARRGQQTHAELNAQDLAMFDEHAGAFRVGVKQLGTEESKAWHRAQREAVKEATAHQGQRAQDSMDLILERLGHFKQRHGNRGDE